MTITHEATKTDVSRHFNQVNHHGLNDVEIHVLDFIHDGPHNKMSLEKRLQTEFDWIHKLCSQKLLGLNSIDSMEKLIDIDPAELGMYI